MEREELTATANSGIGSGNLYSAALQMWVGKEMGGECGSWRRLGWRVVDEGLEKKHKGMVSLRSEKREGGRWKAGAMLQLHAIFICLLANSARV